MLQMGCSKKNMHGSWVIVEHMWNPPCTNFSFPQAGGEHTVNTCWTDSDFYSNCHARDTAHMFKDRFHLSHVAFVCHCCWGSTVRSIICLFLAIFSGLHASANSFIWRSLSLNLPSTTSNILELFYPTKDEILW